MQLYLPQSEFSSLSLKEFHMFTYGDKYDQLRLWSLTYHNTVAAKTWGRTLIIVLYIDEYLGSLHDYVTFQYNHWGGAIHKFYPFLLASLCLFGPRWKDWVLRTQNEMIYHSSSAGKLILSFFLFLLIGYATNYFIKFFFNFF